MLVALVAELIVPEKLVAVTTPVNLAFPVTVKASVAVVVPIPTNADAVLIPADAAVVAVPQR